MIQLDKSRFELIMRITLEKDKGEQELEKYEALLADNHIDDEVFANLVRYQITQKVEYLHKAKEIALPGITFENFMDADLPLEYLDLLLEDMEYELKNSMHIVTKQEEYDYYLKAIQDVVNYSREHLSGIYNLYVTVRLYKIAKLVWYQNTIAGYYPLIEDLYHLMKREKFDYYLFKMNSDLIKMAELQSRYDGDKSVNWRMKTKQYKEDEKGLIYLLDLHPFFSTKAIIFWLYYISDDASEYLLEKIYDACDILKDPAFTGFKELLDSPEPKTDLYQNANIFMLNVLEQMKDEWREDVTKLRQVLDLIKIMRDLNLNHYDVTYILQYLNLEAEYEYAWNLGRGSGSAEKIYLGKMKKNESVAAFLGEEALIIS